MNCTRTKWTVCRMQREKHQHTWQMHQVRIVSSSIPKLTTHLCFPKTGLQSRRGHWHARYQNMGSRHIVFILDSDDKEIQQLETQAITITRYGSIWITRSCSKWEWPRQRVKKDCAPMYPEGRPATEEGVLWTSNDEYAGFYIGFKERGCHFSPRRFDPCRKEDLSVSTKSEYDACIDKPKAEKKKHLNRFCSIAVIATSFPRISTFRNLLKRPLAVSQHLPITEHQSQCSLPPPPPSHSDLPYPKSQYLPMSDGSDCMIGMGADRPKIALQLGPKQTRPPVQERIPPRQSSFFFAVRKIFSEIANAGENVVPFPKVSWIFPTLDLTALSVAVSFPSPVFF